MALGEQAGSTLAMEEFFEAGDPRFLDELLASRADRTLAAFAARWHADPRPFARRALLDYVLDGCDRPRHRPLVKRLFKAAEAAGDDEALGCFLVAFDRLGRRRLTELKRWDWQARQPYSEWVLADDKGIPARDVHRPAKPGGAPPKGAFALDRFSRRTRRYLRRRAFRYFRKLGRVDVERYGRAIRAALARYDDAHLSTPENLLDAWGLVHVLYWGSPVLVRRPNGVVLAEGRRLADLAPAPIHPAAWRGRPDELLALALHARSRTVRRFVVAWLEANEAAALRALPVARLRPLLASPHDELQSFAARLLETATGLENLPLADWLALLELDNPDALPLLCRLVERHVAPARLTLAQAVRLACARATPVAELGLRWAKARPVDGPDDLAALLPLRDAESPRVRAEGAAWVAGLVAERPFATARDLRDLVDARHADVRAPALAALAAVPRFAASVELWGALAESPYDDVRAHLVRHLEDRLDALPPGAVRHVWASALLAVHRGGRAKQRVALQVAREIAARPGEAGRLLPLLAVVLRSVRAPERRGALGAIARAVWATPSLRAPVAAALPELTLLEEGAP